MKHNVYHTLGKPLHLFLFLLFFSTSLIYGQAPTANFSASSTAGCSPLIVSFQDLSTGSPATWSWDFGNGNTSSLQNPTASYFTPGTYTVRLTVTNASGSNTLTRTAYITVYENPVVDFSANVTSGCFPLPVQFTDLSTAGTGNTNVSWQWDFGNGQTSTVQNPTVTYTSSGVYTVILRVTNDKGCSRTFSRPAYISVTNGVTAGFTNTQPTVCSAPAAISFTNSSTGPGTLTYQWQFGDGNSTTAQNPVHTYNSNGSYNVTLIVSSSAGCTDTVRSATPVLIGGFNTSFSSPAQVCTNQPASFAVTSSPAPVTVSWNFGDGNTSTQANPTHTYSSPGTYTVWMYNTYSNCTDSSSATLTVNPLPVADFNASVVSICQPPLATTFQDLSTGAVSWQWDFGDGNSSTSQNPSHTYTSYGNYTVTLIVTNSFGCTDTLVRTDYIRVQRPVITIPSLPVRGCIPYTISPVANINTLDAVTSYLWDFGDGTTSTAATPTHTYPVQGTYTVSLTITTSTGCTETLTIPGAVRVGSLPVADFSAAPTTQCAHQTIQFTDLSVPADQWLWNFGDGSGTSTLQNPVYTYTVPGIYSVTLIATNNGCPDTAIRSNYITVLPPSAAFSFAANCANRTEFQFTDLSTTDPALPPLSWLWDFGDGTTSTLQNPLHVFPSLGVYSVTLTVTNGGCSHSVTLTVRAIDADPDFTANQTVACKPAAINFTATNISLPDISLYQWDFGDGIQQNTTSANISHTYPNSGTYTVRLITVDINGCRDTIIKTNYIRINGPVANFDAPNTSGCIGLDVIFNDLSTNDGINNIVNWRWDFGDGTVQTFTGPPFQHTYAAQGIYSVKLVVTDAAGCMDSITRANYIAATNPQANFTSANVQTCPGATVNFSNTSTATYTILTSFWDFGDGTTLNTPSVVPVSHVYTATGFYDVTLTISDVYGCSDSITRNLYIRVDEPVASFTVSDSISSCSPLQVQFTNTSTYYSSVLWDFGLGGTSTLNNPVHYYTAPGVYTAMLVATSPGGCRDTAYQTITLYDTAGSVINYIPDAGCKPLDVSFSASTGAAVVNYIWDFGDGTSATTTTPAVNHTYNSFGNFLPRLILEDPSGCFIPITGLDTVRIIGADAHFGFDRNLLCDSGQVVFTDSTTSNDPVVTYNWSFGDGGSSSLQNPVHQYSAPGIYSLTLAVTTQNGCTDTATFQNAVTVVASPVIDINGPDEVCVGGSMLHTGIFLQPDTSAVAWLWNFPNGNTSVMQDPPTQQYNTAGNFTINAIAVNSSGCRDTASFDITVHPLPTVTMPPSITIQNGFPATIPATYSPGVINWSWLPSTGLSCTGCANPDAMPAFTTTYQVGITDTNGCSNTGSIQVIVICSNSNLFIPNTFSPNGDGSNDVFYPRGRGLNRVRSLRIFNRWGEVVFERRDFPVNDAASGWNGTFKGRKPQADVYVYQAEVFCDNGELIKLNGNIALIL